MGEYVKYYQAEEPGSFSGEHSFQKKKIGNPAKRWFEAQDAYTLHKPVKRKFFTATNHCSWCTLSNASWFNQFFLVWKKYNNNCKYILVLIDVFSKVAHAAVLKNKNSQCMIEAFTNLLEKTHFSKLQTNRGTKFTNALFSLLVEREKYLINS